ncbi:ferritin, middle subunit-like [Myotis lucifugus]|uniref:ferritin, middle subunit-like n=1 Tax=Myotis lucifugus TaxID=59463 RepID=UPI000CCC95A2|nr:ferritin, middle subunit-like [Myotis lucifugus]
MEEKKPLREECSVAVNKLASFKLHISDAYLFMRPEIDKWGTGIKALECALKLEDQLTKLLLDLKTTASVNKEYDLLCFLGKFLDEQEENTDNLKIQLRCRKRLENQAKKEKDPLKKPADMLGK